MRNEAFHQEGWSVWVKRRAGITSLAGWLWSPLVLVILAPFVLLSPLLVGRQALFWGTPLLQFVPWWETAWEALRSGHLPLWNPLVGMGAPLAANHQSALFYPPTWLYFLLAAAGGLPALAWGQALLVALHLAWAGLGMARLAQRLGLGLLAQMVAGLGFGLSGYLVSRSAFLSINAAAAWTPWILLGAWRVARENGSKKDVLFLAGAVAFQLLAGHAQTAWYTLLLAGVMAGFWGWRWTHINCERTSIGMEIGAGRWDAARVWAVPLKALYRMGLAVLLGAALAAVQLLPTAEYLIQSQRAAAVEYESAMTYSFWPWRLLTLLAPHLFGSPASGDYWGYANYWEDAIYVGLLPVLLGLGALFSSLRRSDREKRLAGEHKVLTVFLFTLCLVALVLALGKNTPVFPWLYRHIPTFDMFQAPARFMLWGEVSLALLAALGANGWRRPERRGLYWTRLGTVGAFAVTLGAGLAWMVLGKISPTAVRATALAGFLGIGAGVLSLTAPAKGGSEDPAGKTWLSAWTWAVGVFLVGDLLLAGWGLNPGVDLDLYRHPQPAVAQVRESLDGHRLYLPEKEEYRLKFKRFLSFKSYSIDEDWGNLRGILVPNINLLEEIASANNFDPLVPGRYARWMSALVGEQGEALDRLLALMDVALVERVGPAHPSGVGYRRVEGASRVRWVGCSWAARSETEAWNLVMDPKVDLRQEVILEGAAQPSICQVTEIPSLRVLESGPNTVRVQVDAADPGWLVLSDVWYPGWEAEIDGRPARMYRANYLFRAVEVPEGAQEVKFIYRPRSFWLGLSLSLAAAAFILAVFLRPSH